MRKLIDRLIKWLSPPEPPATVQSLVFNVPLSQIEQWTEDTLKDWLRITGTPENKIKEKALDIRVLLSQSGKELKEPRRVWNKFTIGSELSEEELREQKDAISKLLGFGDTYAPCNDVDGLCLSILHIGNFDDKKRIFSVEIIRHSEEYDTMGWNEAQSYRDSNCLAEFDVVNNQLDLDEIRAAIAKLKGNPNANK